ncbi:MAG: hypothetical protein O7D91_03685 [Planctomycetota bacterium]|nr:hypothetical protein [Planctomycetota bacterium]
MIQLRLEFQENPVADEVSAITAVVRPILEGLLYSLKKEVVEGAGGYEGARLLMLPRLYRPGDGDCGLCFEYAIHDALNRHDPRVKERLLDALNRCNVRGTSSASILFGAEKTGALRLIDTAKEILTDESRLLAGSRGQPAKLRRHIDAAAAAFRRKAAQYLLPWTISGIWKADLFVGFTDTDKWVATSVKINRNHLEGARGLRIGIVPTLQGRSDSIHHDEQRNLIVCPIPHDQAFMETFYQGWCVVQQFIAADAKVPKEAALPRAPERQVARYLADRREFPVKDVIEALAPLSQPELLRTDVRNANVVDRRDAESITGALEAPMARPV